MWQLTLPQYFIFMWNREILMGKSITKVFVIVRLFVELKTKIGFNVHIQNNML